jgi:ferric-dicitrate binding protein FerR (iron transport regulator)
MSDFKRNNSQVADEEQALATLMRVAGPRPEVPDAAEKRVYARVLEAWEAESAQPRSEQVYVKVLRAWRRHTAWTRHRGWLVPAGVAATALLAFFLAIQPEPARPLSVATVSKVVPAGTAGKTVFAGETLSTGADEGLSLLLAKGDSLRIDAGSRVRFDAQDRVTLLEGRVYADTGDFVYRNGGLVIDTALGSVTDIGTQFAVAIGDELLDVAVREGRVDVQRQDQELVAVAGERLLVDSAGAVSAQAVEPHSEFWAWTTGLAPDFDIDDKSLLDFLKWVSRESGMELVFASSDSRLSAMRTDLHGSVAGLAPLEALPSVMATTAFRYRIEGTTIVIEN